MAKSLELLLAALEVKPLLSSEHFLVDGTLLRAWASHSSLERIDDLDVGPPPPSSDKGFGGSGSSKKRAKGDFRGLLLSNQTHRSSSDGEARLFNKAPGVRASLSFMGHCVMENRNSLVVASEVSQATGRAERDAALRMICSLRRAHQKTLGADKGYDTREFVADLRISGNMPHVAQYIQDRRSSAIDGRTMRHQGYAQPINARKPIEQVLGWINKAARPEAAQEWELYSGCMWWPQPDPHHQPAQDKGGDGMKVTIREPRAPPTRLRTTLSGPLKQRASPLQAVDLIDAAP